MKKIFCLCFSLFLAFSCCITAFAAQPSFAVTVSKYNSGTRKYDPAVTATSGDLLLVSIEVRGVLSSLSCLNLKLGYDSSLVTYVAGSGESHMVPGNPGAGSPLFTDKASSTSPPESYLIAYLGADQAGASAAFAENVTGTVLTFLFSCGSTSGNADFTLTVKEIFNKNYKPVALASKTAKGSVEISGWSLSAETKALFEKIVTVTYPGSGADIEAAQSAYALLGSAGMLHFKKQYPALFEAYSTAWTRYYDLAQKTQLDALEAEISTYQSTYASVLALNADSVNKDNYQAVKAAYRAFEKLSPQARARMGPEAACLTQLNLRAKEVGDRLDETALADEMAEEFISMYAILWPLNEQTVRSDYANLMPRVVEGKQSYNELDFDHMSPQVLSNIQSYGTQLAFLMGIIEQAAAADEQEQALLNEISAFTGQWLYVLKLNSLKVTIGDESAVKMMLEAFDKLSPNAQTRMSSRKTAAEDMLKLIESLKNISKDNPGVIVPTENQKPGGTVEKIVYRDVAKPIEVEKLKTQQSVQVMQVPALVRWMMILACAAMLTVFIPVVIYLILKRRERREGLQ